MPINFFLTIYWFERKWTSCKGNKYLLDKNVNNTREKKFKLKIPLEDINFKVIHLLAIE